MSAEEIGAVRLSVGADVSPFEKDLKAAQAAVRGFSQRASADLKTFATTGNAVTGKLTQRIGMVSLQLQDVAVQLGTGTNVMRIFAQQGSQVLSIFGPWGMILGAAAAVVGTLTTSLFSLNKGIQDLPPGADAAAQAIRVLNKSAADYRDTLAGTTQEQRDFITGLQDFRAKMAAQNAGALSGNIAGAVVNQLSSSGKVPGSLGERLNTLGKLKGDITNILTQAALSGDPNQVVDAATKLGLATVPGAGEMVLQLIDLAKEIASSKAYDEAASKAKGLIVPVHANKPKTVAARNTFSGIAESYRIAAEEAQAFNTALADGRGTIAVQAHYAVMNELQSKNLKLTQDQIDALEELKRQQLYAAASRAELTKTAANPSGPHSNAFGPEGVAALAKGSQKAVSDTTVEVQILAGATQQAAHGISSLFSSLQGGAEGAITAVANLAASISDLIVQQLILAGIGTGLNAFAPGVGTAPGLGTKLGLPHFALGGTGVVRGSGGTDSQLVAFRATPGERVTVDRPGQGRTAAGPTFYIDNRGADYAGQRQLAAQIAQLQGQIVPMAVAGVAAKSKRSVGFRKGFGL